MQLFLSKRCLHKKSIDIMDFQENRCDFLWARFDSQIITIAFDVKSGNSARWARSSVMDSACCINKLVLFKYIGIMPTKFWSTDRNN